jgi:hypothetical protein
MVEAKDSTDGIFLISAKLIVYGFMGELADYFLLVKRPDRVLPFRDLGVVQHAL